MRRYIFVIVVAASLLAGTTPAAGVPTRHGGRLAGTTEILRGCPAQRPVSGCTPTQPLPNACLSVAKLTVSGRPGVYVHLVVADAHALFSVALPAGRYVITPLAQAGAPGGATVVLRVRAGHTTRVAVRFRSSHPIA